jgi:hypothetical protein
MRRQCHAPVGHQLWISVVAAERRLEAQVAEDARENRASVSVHMAPGRGPYVTYCPSQARVGGVDGSADLSLAAFHSASHGVESTARTEGVVLILRPKSHCLASPQLSPPSSRGLLWRLPIAIAPGIASAVARHRSGDAASCQQAPAGASPRSRDAAPYQHAPSSCPSSPPSRPWWPASSPHHHSWVVKQCRYRDLKRFCKLGDVLKRDVALAPLDTAQIGCV